MLDMDLPGRTSNFLSLPPFRLPLDPKATQDDSNRPRVCGTVCVCVWTSMCRHHAPLEGICTKKMVRKEQSRVPELTSNQDIPPGCKPASAPLNSARKTWPFLQINTQALRHGHRPPWASALNVTLSHLVTREFLKKTFLWQQSPNIQSGRIKLLSHSPLHKHPLQKNIKIKIHF